MVNKDRVPELLEMGYECLKNADLGSATKFFDQALHENFEHPEVLFALKCARFWKERIEEIDMVETSLAKGDLVLARWKTFKAFLTRITGDSEPGSYAFKRMVFSVALDFYLSATDEEKSERGHDFDFRVGRCRKLLGDYETALAQLERAVSAKKNEAKYLAELADCHAISGDQRMAKILFREAFFLAPERIELEYLESDIVQKLVGKLKELGFGQQEMAEWIPVYGELTGLFGVKRELTQSESTHLNSSMFQLENDMKENPGMSGTLKPRLLTRYFWIVDHFKAIGADNSRIDKILLKIRLLDEDIFRQYVS